MDDTFNDDQINRKRESQLDHIQKLAEHIRGLPLWSERSTSHLGCQRKIYSKRRCFLSVAAFDPSEINKLKESCKEMLKMISIRHCSLVLTRVLEQLAELAVVYYPVRHILNLLGAARKLRSIDKCVNDEKVNVLAEKVKFTLEKNDIYAFCEAYYQRLTYVPEVDGEELRIGLEPYLKNPQLSGIAQKHYAFLEPGASNFIRFVMASMMPECVDLRYTPQNADAKKRVLAILLHHVTGPYPIERRLEAMKNLVQMIFRCRNARTILTEMDIIPALLQASENETTSQDSASQLYVKLVKRAELCLRDYYVLPLTKNYSAELNETLLDLIFAYLRTPDRFFIAANALSYIWIDILPKTSKDLFIRLLSFLVESYSEILEYQDRTGVELLYTSVLKKLEQLGNYAPEEYVEICHSQEANKLLRLFTSGERQYPAAHNVARRIRFPGIEFD